jgi:hypothetical protein
MVVNRLQNFLDLAAQAPPERDGRHFRTWQRVSVQVQHAVRALAAQTFFAEEWRAAINLDRAYTIVVYASCQPCYGRRPMEFTYDIGDLVTLTSVLRLIGRGMQARLAQISAGIQSDPRLKRRFLPVWHLDILKAVKNKPRTLIEMLAREGAMINALIELGTTPNDRAQKRFEKYTAGAARLLGVDSGVLQDLVLRTGAEHLGDGRILEDGDAVSAGSPDFGVSGNEDRDDGSADGRGQMADAGVVSDIHACR